jgi:trehalose synthase
VIESYTGIAPRAISCFFEAGGQSRGKDFLHVNSTREGGGCGDPPEKDPHQSSLGINARWEIITGDERFFDTTKKVHNALQGYTESSMTGCGTPSRDQRKERAGMDLDADAVLIHDPQLFPCHLPEGSVWIWRCHIDVSNPQRDVFNRIGSYATRCDAAIYSVARFAGALGITSSSYLRRSIPCPRRTGNSAMKRSTIRRRGRHPPGPPSSCRYPASTGSRTQRCYQAYRMVKKYNDCVLVLAAAPRRMTPKAPRYWKRSGSSLRRSRHPHPPPSPLQ